MLALPPGSPHTTVYKTHHRVVNLPDHSTICATVWQCDFPTLITLCLCLPEFHCLDSKPIPPALSAPHVLPILSQLPEKRSLRLVSCRILDNCVQAIVEQDVHELKLANLLNFVELLRLRKLTRQLFTLIIQLDALTRITRLVIDGSADFQLLEVVTTSASTIFRLVESDDLSSCLCHKLGEFLLRILLLVLRDPHLSAFDIQLGFQLPVFQIVPPLRREDLLITKEGTHRIIEAFGSSDVEMRRAWQRPVDDNAATRRRESEQPLEKNRPCLMSEEVEGVLQQNDVEADTSGRVFFESA
jgi:hypothetical protein